MIGVFLTWWLDHLAQLLPRWLRRPEPFRLDAIVIRPTAPLDRVSNLAISSRRNGKEAPLGDFPARVNELRQASLARGRPVVLNIGRAEFLEKTLTLPLAARRELDQV